ncbi:MAG: LysR family transcriptional regulator [Deltaproteobacteria bacterium]|nr:LysR family transcriptional regulator [Deltaproteobacteria bacterium]NCP02616.1 LysR family transcriptional regulator [Deltaproteobacteria bacterium]
MESVYLKTLIEVVRTGSLTKAADSLCVTQSAVSRRIKFLEDRYERNLLDRSGPLLVPTDDGQLVLKKAEMILELESELLAELTSLSGKKPLAFVCTPTFGIVHLPDILREFMLKSSELENFRFVFEMPGEIIKGLNDGLYEMALIEHCQCLDLKDFETLALPGDEMVFAVSPALNLDGGVEPLEVLLQQTLFARDEGCCSRTLLETNLQKLGHSTKEFHRIVVYDDLHVIVRALIEGEGVAFISNELIAEDIKQGRLMTFKVANFVHNRSRTFLYNNRFAAGGTAALFVETIFEHFPQVDKHQLPYCCSMSPQKA